MEQLAVRNKRKYKLIAIAALFAGWTAISIATLAQQPAAVPKTAIAKPAGASATPAVPPPTPAEISTWLAQLDDRQYRVREQATQRLLAAGTAALEPLTTTANGQRPEPADRAVWLLQQFGNAKELPLRRAALERLAVLKDRPQVAGAAASALAVIRHQEAKQAVERLGGRFVQNEIPGLDPRAIPQALILDDNWKGEHADLALLGDLIGLRQVFVIGTKLTANDLAEMQHVSDLEALHMYGTPLEPADVEGLRAQLPQATLDYRRGALLGVTGSSMEDGPPAAINVQSGSAAALAGIEVGDVIRRFDGQEVKNFKALTDLISTHHPGDEVAIEIVRNGATKKIKVKLGTWSAEHVIKQLNPP
jgi:hypothetical protein